MPRLGNSPAKFAVIFQLKLILQFQDTFMDPVGGSEASAAQETKAAPVPPPLPIAVSEDNEANLSQ